MLPDASQNGEAVVASQHARLDEDSLLALFAPIEPLGQMFSTLASEAAISTTESGGRRRTCNHPTKQPLPRMDPFPLENLVPHAPSIQPSQLILLGSLREGWGRRRLAPGSSWEAAVAFPFVESVGKRIEIGVEQMRVYRQAERGATVTENRL
jgi:hypothetical protein